MHPNRITTPVMTTVFHARSNDRFIGMKQALKRKEVNRIKQDSSF